MSKESTQYLKVAIVGDAAVGKTSLIERLVYDRFTPNKEKTVGMEMDEKIYALSQSEKIVLRIYDIASPRLLTHIFYRDTALLCIVIDATYGSDHHESKIKQIERYLRELDEPIQSNRRQIIVIENKSDLPNAVRLTDDELATIERLGVDRRNYIYVSAKLDRTSDDKSIARCFDELSRAYIEINPRVVPSQVVLPAIESAAPASYAIFSIAWWLSLLSSSAVTITQFEKADDVRAQIDRFSDDDVIKVLQAIHKHLVRGNAADDQAKPFELSLGGGSNTLGFFDRFKSKEVECVYKHTYPDNILRWLSVCAPYVYYRRNMPDVYVNTAKQDLLRVFNNIIKTVSNTRSSWLRYSSTEAFYKALPTFFDSEGIPENQPLPSSSASELKPPGRI